MAKMEKLSGGAGYFDIRMSREDHSTVIKALRIAQKNPALISDAFEPMSERDILAAIDGFYAFTTDDKAGAIVRQSLFPYMDTVVILKKIAYLIEEKKLNAPDMDAGDLQALAADLNSVLPEEEITADLFPDEYKSLMSLGEDE